MYRIDTEDAEKVYVIFVDWLNDKVKYIQGNLLKTYTLWDKTSREGTVIFAYGKVSPKFDFPEGFKVIVVYKDTPIPLDTPAVQIKLDEVMLSPEYHTLLDYLPSIIAELSTELPENSVTGQVLKMFKKENI